MKSPRKALVRPAWLGICALGVGVAVDGAGARGQQGTFRAAVDVIAIDVQVVDEKGLPVPKLGIGDFEVSIDGRRRRIVSADFIRQASADVAMPVRSSGPVASNSFPTSSPTSGLPAGRMMMLAVDVGSLSASTSREVMTAARAFVGQLPASDLVGLYAFPIGPRLVPTADHAAISRALDSVIGSSTGIRSEFHLRPSEVVDITSEVASSMPVMGPGGGTARGGVVDAAPSETVRRVQQRENCLDARCATRIRMEATTAAFELEARVNQSVDGLRNLLQGLSLIPGRKTLVLLSGGVVVSDRPGGRPDMGGIERALGQEVALANTAVYTLHFDTQSQSAFSTENSRGERMPTNRERDSSLVGRWLDMFSGASGGTLLKVVVGSGESAFERVLRETSAFYLIGVEPEQADRDGRTRQLRVRVNQRGLTLRSRTWVALPKK